MRPTLSLSLIAMLGLSGIALTPGNAAESSAEQTSNADRSPAPVDVLHLDNESVWDYARSNAYAVQAAQAALEASKSQRSAQLSPYRPQISAGLSWRRYGDKPRSSSGALGDRHSYSGEVTLEQQLFTFGRLYYTSQITKSSITSAEQSLIGSERDAALRAITALEAYRFAVATCSVAQARVKQREGELADAEKLFEVGNVRMLDVRETRINLTRAQDGLRQTEADVEGAKADLISALALNSDTAITIDDKLLRPTNLNERLDTAQAATKNNVDQRILEQSRILQQQQAKKELSDSMPNVTGILGYSESGRRLNDLNDDWYVGVGVQWRLFDGGGRYARRNAFLAQARAVDAQIDALVSERQREISVIQADASALAARIALQESVVKDTELNYDDARILYQSGEITLTRVGEAGLALTEAQFNLNRYSFEESVLAHRLRALSE